MRRLVAGLLSTLILAGVVFAGSAVVAPPAAAADSWEDGLKQLEAEYGVTRKQCDDDWLGLRVRECSVIERYQYYDTPNGNQYGFTSEQAVESAKQFQASPGSSPTSPGTLVASGAAAASTTAAGMTAAQASAYWTGMFALTGAGLMSVVGNPPWTWNIDEETTDLDISGSTPGGWLAGDNMAGNVRVEILSAPDFLVAGEMTVLFTTDGVPVGHTGYVPLTQVRNNTQSSGVTFSFGSSPGQRAQAVEEVRTFQLGSGWEHLQALASLGTPFSNKTVYWYPPGHEFHEPPVEGGMVGTLTTTLECTSSEGVEELVFTETFSGGFEMEVGGKECPSGHVLTGGRADWTTAEGTQEVWNYDAPDSIKNIPVEFDYCLTGADCGLGLWRILTDGEIQSCGALAIGCQNWWGHANKTDVYQCRAGGSVVDLGYCAHLRQPGQISPVTGVDVTPDGKVVPQERIVSLDPEDFAHLIQVPVTVPEPQPGPVPGPQPPPPPPPPAPMPEPDITQETRECWPSGWGLFNPFEWVYRPIQCAFVWAFVPNRAVDTAPLLDAFDASILGYIIGYFDSLSGAFDGLGQFSQQCGVIASTEMNHLGGGELEITTCSPIVEAIRPWMHIALSVLAVGGAVLFTINAVMASFGLAGVLSTAPTDDKKDDK